MGAAESKVARKEIDLFSEDEKEMLTAQFKIVSGKSKTVEKSTMQVRSLLSLTPVLVHQRILKPELFRLVF